MYCDPAVCACACACPPPAVHLKRRHVVNVTTDVTDVTRSHARRRAQVVYYLLSARARLLGKALAGPAHLALLLAGENLSSASRAALQTVGTSRCSSGIIFAHFFFPTNSFFLLLCEKMTSKMKFVRSLMKAAAMANVPKHIDHFSKFSPSPLSMKQFLDFGE